MSDIMEKFCMKAEKKLLKILAKIEAKIDFPDEDLPIDVINQIQSISKKVKNEITQVLNDQKVGERMKSLMKV